MAKFYGPIGFVTNKETSPDVWTPETVVKNYPGDFNRNSRSLQGSDKVNDDVNISNEISILADPYAKENFHSIRFVGFMGTNWKVSNVTVDPDNAHRLLLTLGGEYNGV